MNVFLMATLITIRLILELQGILMEGARGTNVAHGEFRKIQNFIDPTNKTEDALYIPVGANEIESYMENWEIYANKHPYGEKLTTDHSIKNEIILDEDSHPLLKVAVLHYMSLV